jgi:hypothetical protein
VAEAGAARGRGLRRGLIGLVGVAVAVLAIVAAAQIGPLLPGDVAAATGSPGPGPTAAPAATATEPTPTELPPTAPPPTPVPTPVTVPAPLTGLPVSEEAALRQPIAVMVDDHADARPQSGLNAASVVWHAPAEFGIPRYMLVFQDQIPESVGPIRSARQYYVEWAAEWESMYVHAGGSPQAIATLNAKGQGQWVYNADHFRWGGRYLWRTTDRFSPHNVYTDGEHLRDLAKRLGAVDEPLEPVWSFAPDRARELRPNGGKIEVVYPYETITYRYDAATNRYVRYLNGAKKPQVDRADGEVVAPRNVVILRMNFGALLDGHPSKHRLEAQNVGKGQAWIATNGRTVKGTWSKASRTAPTLLFGPDGAPIRLTAGQTFVQVIALNYLYEIDDGARPYWIPPTHRDP